MNTIPNPKAEWHMYCTEEMQSVVPILSEQGITLEKDQPHISGERYLQQAVTTASGRKLILLGNDARGVRIVIKATRNDAGKEEIERERRCRTVLTHIDFAGAVFHTPKELHYIQKNGFLITATEFIDQECAFLDRPLEEQFALALRGFKGQESAHATTWNHRALIGKTFGIRTADSYLHTFATFSANIKTAQPQNETLIARIETSEKLLREHATYIDQYCGFLTHTDFVPHNIRVCNNTIFLLDYSSLTFGNKYEGWARFLNFMTLYNPELESALVTYVAQNRTPEESIALRMMRIYRLGEIIWYYIQASEKSTGELLELNTIRIGFWSDVLSYILNNEPVPETLRLAYIEKRDSLRSDDEKMRQKGLH